MTRVASIVPAALMAWSVALLLVFFERASWWVFGAAVALCGFAVCWREPGKLAAMRAITLVAGLAIAAVSLSVAAQVPAREGAREAIGRAVTIDAVVMSNSKAPKNERTWVDVLASIDGGGAVPLKLAVAAGDSIPFGATVRVFGDLGEAWGAGAAVATLTAHRAPEIVSDGGFVLRGAAVLRDKFITRAARLPGSGAELLPGLAVGDTRAVSANVEQAMLHSGLSHLTAVSGANCAIVTAIAFGAAALCRAPRSVRVAIALTTLAGFVVLVTPEPSVVRAATMSAIALLALLLGRTRIGGAVLALAVVVIVVADPWIAISAGFALSVASTTALLFLMSPLALGLSRFVPLPLAWAVAAPLSAQLACGPIIALFSNEQSLVSVLANLLATPVAPVVTVVGMIGCLMAPFPPLANLAVASAWLPAQWIASTAEVSASLPGVVVPVVAGPIAAVAVTLMSVAVAIVIIRPNSRFFDVGNGRIAQPIAVFVVCCTLAWGASAALLRTVLAPVGVPSNWAIAACDVGQGDAFVVRDASRVALIDTGETPEALQACMRRLDVHHIDVLVLTHFDLDHIGGASAVLGRVDTVLFGTSDSPESDALLLSLQREGAVVQQVTSGMSGTLGDAKLRVLWPRSGERVFAPGNAQSVVVSIDHSSGLSMLALGDLGESSQRALAIAHPYMRADVVKVAHHGSADQYGELYDGLGASIALIGVGEGNLFGHPRQEILDVLTQAGMHTVRTDRDGLTVLIPEPDGSIRVWRERPQVSEGTGSLVE